MNKRVGRPRGSGHFPHQENLRTATVMHERIAFVAQARGVSTSQVIREWLTLGIAAAEAGCPHAKLVDGRCAECGKVR